MEYAMYDIYAILCDEIAKTAVWWKREKKGIPGFRWCSSRVITSLHNVHMGTRELHLCEANAKFFNFLLTYIMGLFCNENAGIQNHASTAYFAPKSAIYAAKVWRIWKNADLADYVLNYVIA